MSAIVPISRCPISVRPATLDDIPFMDGLQAQYPKQLGRFATSWFEGYIKMGGVLIAEEDKASGRMGERASEDALRSPPRPDAPSPPRRPLGYVISRDRYQKRDELGIIYHLCVAPGEQRKLVGAELIRAVFDRSAYGCKLYCCWCAQDIEANYFWESIGFVPIAFRAGSATKSRVHIFWQKRIREGDTSTSWWFPSETTGGAIGEGRIVLPIPPGTHWSDAKPVILPGEERVPGSGSRVPGEKQKRLPGSARNPRRCARVLAGQPENRNPKADLHNISLGGLRAAAPKPVAPAKAEPKPKRVKQKNDPQFLAKARELRDRYLEHVNSGKMVLASAGKYDLSRTLVAPPAALYQLPSAA